MIAPSPPPSQAATPRKASSPRLAHLTTTFSSTTSVTSLNSKSSRLPVAAATHVQPLLQTMQMTYETMLNLKLTGTDTFPMPRKFGLVYDSDVVLSFIEDCIIYVGFCLEEYGGESGSKTEVAPSSSSPSSPTNTSPSPTPTPASSPKSITSSPNPTNLIESRNLTSTALLTTLGKSYSRLILMYSNYERSRDDLLFFECLYYYVNFVVGTVFVEGNHSVGKSHSGVSVNADGTTNTIVTANTPRPSITPRASYTPKASYAANNQPAIAPAPAPHHTTNAIHIHNRAQQLSLTNSIERLLNGVFKRFTAPHKRGKSTSAATMRNSSSLNFKSLDPNQKDLPSNTMSNKSDKVGVSGKEPTFLESQFAPKVVKARKVTLSPRYESLAQPKRMTVIQQPPSTSAQPKRTTVVQQPPSSSTASSSPPKSNSPNPNPIPNKTSSQHHTIAALKKPTESTSVNRIELHVNLVNSIVTNNLQVSGLVKNDYDFDGGGEEGRLREKVKLLKKRILRRTEGSSFAVDAALNQKV